VNKEIKTSDEPFVKDRTEFKSSHDHPFEYPGEPPDHSFTTDGEKVMLTITQGVTETEEGEKKAVFQIADPETGEMRDLDSYLENIGVPTMADRIPVVAYGANANPASLFRKFNFGDEGNSELLLVPVIKATRKGSEIAWSRRLGARGRQYADMVTSDKVEDTEVNIAVNFLTHDQLALMHSSEKAYDIVEQGVVELEGGITIPAFYYSATSGEVYGVEGVPVAVSAIKATNRHGEEHTAESSLQSVLDRLDVGLEGVSTASEFLNYYEPLTDVEKQDLRQQIDEKMGTEGFGYTHQRPAAARVHEWSFDSLPTLKQLLNGYEQTGIQGRLFTNDLISSLGKRVIVEEVLRRDSVSQ